MLESVSVIIPCRNSAAYIGRALDSVAAQVYPPAEVIVIDDGSTDNTRQTVQDHHAVTLLLDSPWRNGAGTRNVGIERATGDWIAFLDADDYWLPNHLERAMRLLSRGSDVAYLSHNHVLKNGQVIQSPCRLGGAESEWGLPHGEYMRRYVSNLYYAMSPVVVDRARLLEVGCLDVSQTRRHDIDMWLRVIHERTWSFDPAATSVYQHDTPGAISRNIPDREWYFLRCLLRNRNEYKDSGIDLIIGRIALRVYSSAFTDGDLEDISRADELAWAHLSLRDKYLVRLMRTFPSAFRRINRKRRAKLFGVTPSVQTEPEADG